MQKKKNYLYSGHIWLVKAKEFQIIRDVVSDQLELEMKR